MSDVSTNYEGKTFLTHKQIYNILLADGFTPMCTFTDEELDICQQQEEMAYEPPDLKDRHACVVASIIKQSNETKPVCKEEISDADLLGISDEDLLA